MKLTREAQEARDAFREALSQNVPIPDLSILFENAIRSAGREIKSATVTRRSTGYGFRIEVDLPGWAQDHVDRMNTEAEQAVRSGVGATTLPLVATEEQEEALWNEFQAFQKWKSGRRK